MLGEFFIRCCVTVVTLTAVMQLHSWNIWTLAVETNPVCNTPECRRIGEAFKRNMNESYQPCRNFYKYVCDNWPKYNPNPKYGSAWDLGGKMEHDSIITIKSLLEDKTVSNVKGAEEAKKLYKACLNIPFFKKDEPSAVKNMIIKIGNWPMFFPKNQELKADLPWWKIDEQYIRVTGESALFSFGVEVDLTDSRRPIITRLKPLSSHYGMVKRFKGWGGLLSTGRTHYVNFLKDVINSVAPADPNVLRKTIDKDLADVMKFRENLDKLKNLKCVQELKPLDMFQVWYDSLTAGRDNNAKINWLDMIRAFYKDGVDPYGSIIQFNSRINVDQCYMEKIIPLLNATPKRVIVNHIHLYFAERHVKFTPRMEEELKQSVHFDDEGLLNGYIRYPIPRKLKCVVHHNMLVTLARMYIDAKFPKSFKNSVEILVREAKVLLRNQIMDSTWLDRETKTATARKIAALKYSIGYPDWYMDPHKNIDLLFKDSDERDPTEIYPLQPEGYYLPRKNILYLTAASLQWPVYSPNMPYVIDSAATISAIGYSLNQIVDADGITFDADGSTPWWSSSMISKYDKEAKCFELQYGEYRKREILKRNLTTSYFLPSTTKADISDVMGLKLGYKRFLQHFTDSRYKCPVLPGFEKYGCEKLFFIAFGNLLCSNYSPMGEEEILFGRPHSLFNVRLNGAVANMKEFSKAFDCKPKDPLNLKKRCDIWKPE